MNWKVRGIRGATTASENTKQAIEEAVIELLDAIETQNQLDPEDIVSATFTATPDLDAIFPAAIARQRPDWQNVPIGCATNAGKGQLTTVYSGLNSN